MTTMLKMNTNTRYTKLNVKPTSRRTVIARAKFWAQSMQQSNFHTFSRVYVRVLVCIGMNECVRASVCVCVRLSVCMRVYHVRNN